MPGLAAIFNRPVPDAQSIQLFFNTSNLNLSLQLMSGDPNMPDLQRTFSSTSADHAGIIINQSYLGTASVSGNIVVVGLTQNANSSTVYDVSIISPIFKPLAQTEIVNKVGIAMSSSPTDAWVYYLSGPDQASKQLQEYSLTTFAATSLLDPPQILQGSNLATYYSPDSNKRFVIYQAAESANLFEYCVDTGNADHIRNSSEAQKGTTLAVMNYMGKVYLYYTDNDYLLRRIVKTGATWGSSTPITGSPIDQTCQLTVTNSSKLNHLFYLQKGQVGGNFVHIKDPVDIDTF